MAISIQYQPSAALMGSVALEAGQGLHKQRLADRLEDRNRMVLGAALQDRAAARDFAMSRAQQASQQQARERSQLMDLYANNQRMQQAAAIEQAQRQEDRQFSALGDLQRLHAQREMNGIEFDQQKELTQMRFGLESQERDRIWQEQGVQATEQRVAQIQGEIAKQVQHMTPEGRQIFNDMNGKLTAIQRQRASLRPAQYGDLLNQWQEEFERSGVREQITPPPTVDESWKESASPLPGGGFAVRESDGKGGWKWKHIAGPSASDRQATRMKAASFEEYYADPTDYSKDYDATEKRLHQDKVRERIAAAGEDEIVDTKRIEAITPLPTEEEVDTEMRKRWGRHRKSVGAAQKQPQPSAQQGSSDTEQQPFVAPFFTQRDREKLKLSANSNTGTSWDVTGLDQGYTYLPDGSVQLPWISEQLREFGGDHMSFDKPEKPQTAPPPPPTQPLPETGMPHPASTATPAESAIPPAKAPPDSQLPNPKPAVQWTPEKFQPQVNAAIPFVPLTVNGKEVGSSHQRALQRKDYEREIQRVSSRAAFWAQGGHPRPLEMAISEWINEGGEDTAKHRSALVQNRIKELNQQAGKPATDKFLKQQGAYVGNFPRVKTKDDVDKLPQGATFIAPDGSIRIKS